MPTRSAPVKSQFKRLRSFSNGTSMAWLLHVCVGSVECRACQYCRSGPLFSSLDKTLPSPASARLSRVVGTCQYYGRFLRNRLFLLNISPLLACKESRRKPFHLAVLTLKKGVPLITGEPPCMTTQGASTLHLDFGLWSQSISAISNACIVYLS